MLKPGVTALNRVLFVAVKLVSSRLSFESNVARGLVALSKIRSGPGPTEFVYAPAPLEGLFISQWEMRVAPVAELVEMASPANMVDASIVLSVFFMMYVCFGAYYWLEIPLRPEDLSGKILIPDTSGRLLLSLEKTR